MTTDTVIRAITIGAGALSIGLFAVAAILLSSEESSQPTLATDHGDSATHTPGVIAFPTTLPIDFFQHESSRTASSGGVGLEGLGSSDTAIINGEEVPLPDGFEYVTYYTLYAGGGAGPTRTPRNPELHYDGDPSTPGHTSSVELDQDGHVVSENVRPEDRAIVDALLRGEIRGLTPAPTPAVAQIDGLTIPLPEGMRFSEMLSFGPPEGPRTRNWGFFFENAAGRSRLSVGQNGQIFLSEILPQHESLYVPILTALNDLAE